MTAVSNSTQPQFRARPWWQQLLGATRTRILMLYLLLLLLLSGIATPVFLLLFLARVDDRVRDDLAEEMATFQATYALWEQQPNQSVSQLKQFIADFLVRQVPEDDNYLIFTLEGQYYKSTPRTLPDVIQPNSALMDYWANLTEPTQGEVPSSDSDVGNILYLAQPLRLDDDLRAVFISVHTTAGERQEALAGATIFFQVAAGVVLGAFALAWVATGKLLAPVQKLAVTARSVSESDLTQRIPVKGSGEIADLTNTFNEMLDRLQAAFIAQQNFVNDAGHELRTPLTIIRGHLELLGAESQEQQETLELVIDELDRMNRFVNDLILLVRAEQPNFLQLETIDIPSFTEEIFAKIQTLGDRNWRLTIRGAGQLMGDRQRLTGAIINLAQNAAQHTRMGDLIELGASVSQTEVRFWVRDTGEGIALRDQERIFERFARVAHRSRRSDGAGLGLPIVRAVVEAHSGKVTLQSQVGVGSTFTINLPLHPPEDLADQAAT